MAGMIECEDLPAGLPHRWQELLQARDGEDASGSVKIFRAKAFSFEEQRLRARGFYDNPHHELGSDLQHKLDSNSQCKVDTDLQRELDAEVQRKLDTHLPYDFDNDLHRRLLVTVE